MSLASAVGSGVDHLGINSVALYIAAEIASGGLSGGLGSVIAGGDFWKGAEQGVIATAYNHAVHGLYNKITQDSKSPYDGYRQDKNGNYIRVDGRGGDKIDYLYDEEGNIIASTPVSFTEIEVGPYRRTYGQGTKYVSPALYDPSFDVFAWWASGEVLGAALVKTYRYLSGVGRAAKGVTNLTKSQLKSITSLEKQIAAHTQKLKDFKANPMKFDNKGFLKNAPNDAVRQKIIQGRINHLQQEINTFQNNIQKILNGQ